MTCRCQIDAIGLMTATGTATGSDPRVLSVTCEAVQDCVGAMFDDIGFEYDDTTGTIVVPVGIPADYVLTAVGDGTAVWAAKPFPDGAPPLVWDTRHWTGGGVLANEGTAGHDYDLPINTALGVTRALLDTTGSGTIDWSDLGGNPDAAPFSFIFVLGDNISNAYSAYMEFGFYSTGAVWMDPWMSANASGSQWDTFTVGGPPDISHPDTTVVPDNQSVWVIQVDPTASTVELYRNNVLVDSDSGAPFDAALLTDLTTNADGLFFSFGNTISTTTPGDVWDGLRGSAMTRTLLNSADRLAWAAYFT